MSESAGKMRHGAEKTAKAVGATAAAMHDTFLKKGDMRLTDFGEYLK